jgi:single-stranded-DNA-specific exonuclease
MTPVFNMPPSILQSQWVMPDVNDDDISQIIRDHGVPEIVARLLTARAVKSDGVQEFLNPTLSQHFPNPLKLRDMEHCANYVADNIVMGKKFGALCDFDVDGSTSAAILIKFFRAFGRELPIYIPDRLSDGYGPNAKALQSLKQQGCDIVFIVDCGTTAFEPIAYARSIGLDVIVLDHHEPADTFPDVNYIINPKRRDDDSGYSMLAACGVAFLTCVAINTALRQKNFYAQNNITEPQLKRNLDLVALGTVCDMVPLTGPNRLLVRAGFDQMARMENVGLKALCAVGNIKKPPTPEDAGYVLGPRINAGSRVHLSDLGAKLLACDDAEEANNLAWHLNDCNVKRRSLQADMLKEAVFQVERYGLADKPLIMVSDPSWHVGLNGLVAGQLKERYGKPACVIAFATGESEKLEGRGSGRSIAGFNLAALFMRAHEKGLLLKGGGHAMAAGFTVDPAHIDALHEFFLTEAEVIAQNQNFITQERIDGVMSLRGLKPNFIHMLEKNIGPFGQQNPEPRFVIPSARIVMADIVGEKHVRLQITEREGGVRMKAIAFGAVETDLGALLLGARNGPELHLMGQFKVNEWNGSESVEFHVMDAVYATSVPIEQVA